MRFPARIIYGLRAMADLALHEGQGPISVVAVAKRQGISQASLAQMLHRLRRAGLVTAERGARGGYSLSRPASRISVADIVQAFATAEHPSTAVDQITAFVLTRIELAVSTTLAATTLAELSAEARRRPTHHMVNHSFHFYI
ncbi:MAG: Rrf2 family transcriptional regulator [Candidatus Omnitrophica bacterium]|nr:Rrf2 family transcriptional regulator [Candidatus Omnitrophota bacterium]